MTLDRGAEKDNENEGRVTEREREREERKCVCEREGVTGNEENCHMLHVGQPHNAPMYTQVKEEERGGVGGCVCELLYV